jgi:exoribonuclease R
MRLQPNHFESRQELKQAITDFIAYYNQKAKPIQWTYTIEKLEKKLEQRIKQETEQKPEQKIDQNVKTKPKQKKERNIKGKLKQKLGQKLENNLREKKSLNVERRADQNSARISA